MAFELILSLFRVFVRNQISAGIFPSSGEMLFPVICEKEVNGWGERERLNCFD